MKRLFVEHPATVGGDLFRAFGRSQQIWISDAVCRLGLPTPRVAPFPFHSDW